MPVAIRSGDAQPRFKLTMPVGIGSLRRTRPDVSGRAIKSSAGRYCEVNNEGHWVTMPVRASLSGWRYAHKPFPKGNVNRERG